MNLGLKLLATSAPFKLCLTPRHTVTGECFMMVQVATTLWQSRKGLRIIYERIFEPDEGPDLPWWIRWLAEFRLLSYHPLKGEHAYCLAWLREEV